MFATDDWFAVAENLLKVSSIVLITGALAARGAAKRSTITVRTGLHTQTFQPSRFDRETHGLGCQFTVTIQQLTVNQGALIR